MRLPDIWGTVFLSCMVASACAVESSVVAPQSGQLDHAVGKEFYTGVVTNQTVTVAGYDFYQHFVAAWRERDMAERFALSVYERPSARSGTQVWVEYAQRRIFQAFLPTSRPSIKAVSEQAATVAYQKIVDAEVERLLVRDADIGPDEI